VEEKGIIVNQVCGMDCMGIVERSAATPFSRAPGHAHY